jgi:hypothetical protein
MARTIFYPTHCQPEYMFMCPSAYYVITIMIKVITSSRFWVWLNLPAFCHLPTGTQYRKYCLKLKGGKVVTAYGLEKKVGQETVYTQATTLTLHLIAPNSLMTWVTARPLPIADHGKYGSDQKFIENTLSTGVFFLVFLIRVILTEISSFRGPTVKVL